MYVYEKHSMVKVKAIPWNYCKYCGLIELKNSVTRWCVSKGCNHEEHPQYLSILKKSNT